MLLHYCKKIICKLIVALFLFSIFWLVPGLVSGCISLLLALPIAFIELIVLDSACGVLLEEEKEVSEEDYADRKAVFSPQSAVPALHTCYPPRHAA